MEIVCNILLLFALIIVGAWLIFSSNFDNNYLDNTGFFEAIRRDREREINYDRFFDQLNEQKRIERLTHDDNEWSEGF